MRVKRSYKMQFKRQVLAHVYEIGIDAAIKESNVPRWTVRDWVNNKDKIENFGGSQKSKTTKGQERKEIIPFSHALVLYMKDERRDNNIVTTRMLIEYMKTFQHAWLTEYLRTKKSEDSGQKALMKLCQTFAKRHGFTSQVALTSKLNDFELAETQITNALDFWGCHWNTPLHEIYNMDETSIYYEMAPKKGWAGKGKTDSARVTGLKKHPGRMTAVITVRADGKKLPILFIIKGVPGGDIEKDELKMYPLGHYYCVQENAWMDARGWDFYAGEVLPQELDGPAVMIADNFDCHVSADGQRVSAEKANSVVFPLPPNSTSTCQPLDVGVMGPLKSALRSTWIRQNGPIPKTAKEKRMDIIKRTIMAWESISEKTVRSSFKKAIPREFEAVEFL